MAKDLASDYGNWISKSLWACVESGRKRCTIMALLGPSHGQDKYHHNQMVREISCQNNIS